MLTRDKLTKEIKKLLIDEGITMARLAIMAGSSQQNLNKKINKASFNYVDLVKILDILGYDVRWIKRNP